MSTSDWIAIGAAIIAVLSPAVAVIAFREQAKKDRYDAEKDLADQVGAINDELAKLPQQSAWDHPAEALVSTSNTNATLETLVVRAGDLIDSQLLKPNWFQTAVLAMASLEIADMAVAGRYTRKALKLARDLETSRDASQRSRRALTLSLRMRAMFYFQRGLAGDVDKARKAFGVAHKLIRANAATQGPYVYVGEMIELCFRQASCELALGETGTAQDLIRSAVDEWDKLTAPGPRYGCGMMIDTLARTLTTFVGVDELLPPTFEEALSELKRKSDANGSYGFLGKPQGTDRLTGDLNPGGVEAAPGSSVLGKAGQLGQSS